MASLTYAEEESWDPCECHTNNVTFTYRGGRKDETTT